MLMNSGVCLMGDAKKGTTYDLWLMVPTLTKGRPVEVPIIESDCYKVHPGEEAGVTQVAVNPDTGDVTFTRLKKGDMAPTRSDGDVVALHCILM